MNSEILEIINSIRQNKGETALSSLCESTRLREDAGFDSFDLAELTAHIEAKFGVDVFESGLISTVGELCEKLKGN